MNRRKFLTWIGLAPIVTKVLAEDISKETPKYVLAFDPAVNHNEVRFHDFPKHLPDPCECYFDYKKGMCVPAIGEEPEWIEKNGIIVQYSSLLDEHIRIRNGKVFFNHKEVPKNQYVIKGKTIHFKSKK